MLIFIDESGIHKEVDHSTFVLAYIEFDDYPTIEQKIIAIEQTLKINSFHWAHTVWRVKERFLTEVLKLDFKVKIAVIKNPINSSSELEKILLHTIVEKNIKNRQ